MVTANKESLNAKAYINGKVNDMRKQIVKVPAEKARKQLIKNFREITSSDEYQENLNIVNRDADAIRKSLNPWERREKFGEAREDFYGPLYMWLTDKDIKELEKKDTFEKIDFLFKKLGDGDKTLKAILHLYESSSNDEKKKYEDWLDNVGCKNKFNKLGIDVAKKISPRSKLLFYRILLYDPDAFLHDVWENDDIYAIGDIIKPASCRDFMECFDYRNIKIDVIFKRLGEEKLKSMIGKMEDRDFEILLDRNINEGRNCHNSIFQKKLSKYFDYFFEELNNRLRTGQVSDKPKGFMEPSQLDCFIDLISKSEEFGKYQKEFIDACIEGGYKNKLDYHIREFTGLTDEEKSKILQRNLVREDFDRKLAELEQLGDKLGLTIEVRKKEDENNKNNDKKKGRGWRSWF